MTNPTQTDLKTQQFLITQKNILHELGCDLNTDSIILDFGCGAGKEVYQFRKMGYKAYGCDIDNYYEEVQNRCREEKIINPDETIFAKINRTSYRIPFADETFDYVFSNQVFEHLQNYPEALSEIYRVLKPGGCSLHFFPSRYRPIECHVFVPFAGIFRGYNYLAFWAFLGIRNSYQKGLSFREVAKSNFEYLKNRTTYFTQSKIYNKVSRQFKNASFVEKYFIKYGAGRLRHLYWLSKRLPLIATLIRTFHTRVVFFKKLTLKPL